MFSYEVTLQEIEGERQEDTERGRDRRERHGGSEILLLLLFKLFIGLDIKNTVYYITHN
jgi:hypothetical protein